jgi:long-chain acyl-CoA synthetase
VRHLAKMVPAYKLPLNEGRKVTPFPRRDRRRARPAAGPAPQTLDSVAFLQYTGRHHGLSKGAVLTHRNIVAAILQAEAWFTPALGASATSAKRQCIAALPLYHIFALTLCLLAIRWGAH